ncbi:hypothetical protein OHT20_35340 [Streptomyces caniferus]|uniref:hypothetical protein n=1 Tax=Streptomyces caniferus TaxID=285557 RepID=UPI002E29C631|nr:hypothetical protein [Streptomyces caniferus]
MDVLEGLLDQQPEQRRTARPGQRQRLQRKRRTGLLALPGMGQRVREMVMSRSQPASAPSSAPARTSGPWPPASCRASSSVRATNSSGASGPDRSARARDSAAGSGRPFTGSGRKSGTGSGWRTGAQ